MKYIDADKLIVRLEEQNADKKIIQPLIRIIESLQQEQPEVYLEKEIRWYLREECSSDDEPAVSEIARHFAEFGRKQVLHEIYDGKVKPVDKITAAWLDDEQNT